MKLLIALLLVGWLLALAEAQQLSAAHKVTSSLKHFDEIEWANVRFRNLLTGGSPVYDGYPVDLYVNSIPFLKFIEFDDPFYYMTVPAQTIDLVVTLSGTTDVIAESQIELVANQNYTVVLSGSYDDIQNYPIQLDLFHDNNTLPDITLNKIRVIHLSPGLPNITILTSPITTNLSSNYTTLFDSIGYGQVSTYKTAPAGSAFNSILASSSNMTVFRPFYLYDYYSGVVTFWLIGQYATYISMDVEAIYDYRVYISETPQKTELQIHHKPKRGFLKSFLAKRSSQQKHKSNHQPRLIKTH